MKLVAARPTTQLQRWIGIPTGRQAALWGLPLLLSMIYVVQPAVLAPMVALDLLLVVLLAGDLFLASGAVEAHREVLPVQSVGRAFPVRVTVRNAGARSLQLEVTDAAPGEASGLPVHAQVAPGRALDAMYEVVVGDRGRHLFGEVTVRWTSPLGLWQRQRSVDVADELRVYPDFEPLRSGSLVARASDERVPVRVRRRPGGESEFQRLRPYVAGDPYRHIDWKATARRREFVTREFGQESNQNLIFLIDAGRMMSARLEGAAGGGLTAFDHALNAAVMMGQVALRHGDRVGLLAFDRKVRAWLPPKAGARHGAALIRQTYDLQPSLDEPDYAMAFRYLTGRVRRRSLVVLLTTVVDEVNADLAARVGHALAHRHLPLVVWLRDPEVDDFVSAPPSDATAAYRRGAAAELTAWRERSLMGLRRRGALVVDARPEDLSMDLLSRYLEIKARQLL